MIVVHIQFQNSFPQTIQNFFIKTGSVSMTVRGGRGIREADLRACQREAHNFCLYQSSSRGGWCNLTRLGSPERRGTAQLKKIDFCTIRSA